MGIILAAFVFIATSMGAIHIGHIEEQNTALQQQLKNLKAASDSNLLQLDGMPVRNLGHE